MTNFTRKLQKVFGSDYIGDAGQEQIAVFGSKKTGTVSYSTDPDTIQSSAWDGGFEDAVIIDGNKKIPLQQDVNAALFTLSYNLAYVLQKGIPAYSATTEYYTSDLTREAGTNNLYSSAVDNNIGNSLSDPTKWTFICDLANVPTSPIVDASESTKGIIEIATQAEVNAGSDTTRSIVPSYLKNSVYNNLELISSQTASSSASINFTGLGSGSYLLRCLSVKMATDGVGAWIRLSSDNGVSYDSGPSDYSWKYMNPNNYSSDSSDSEIQIVDVLTSSRTIGNGPGEYFNADIEIFNPSLSSAFCIIKFNTAHTAADGDATFNIGSGQRNTAKAINAFQFLSSSGNITSGTFKLYKIQ